MVIHTHTHTHTHTPTFLLVCPFPSLTSVDGTRAYQVQFDMSYSSNGYRGLCSNVLVQDTLSLNVV